MYENEENQQIYNQEEINKMKERNIVINAKGDEREVYINSSFPDKKLRDHTQEEVDDILIRARRLSEEFEIGQTEATWIPKREYENLPIAILLMTDTHYGSTKVQTELINQHLDIVRETPNFYMVHNGDSVDNFNTTLGRVATGMYEDPLPPQLISRTWALKMKTLDDLDKIGVLGFGNHNDFGKSAGQDWYDTFLSKFNCPIFSSGGILHIKVGDVNYNLAMTHRYWGTSKLNPTNATKRFVEYEYPDTDIAFLGHTHQSEGLQYERGGKEMVGVIGGTYKDNDTWARTMGIGGRAGSPGWVVMLYPDQKRMQLFRDVEVAKEAMENMVYKTK